jgi:hypothetical protein
VLASAGQLLPTFRQRLGEIAVSLLQHEEQFGAVMDSLGSEDAASVISAMEPRVRTETEELATHAEQTEDPAGAEQAASNLGGLIERFGQMIDSSVKGGRKAVAEASASVLLAIDNTDARTTVGNRVDVLAPVESADLTVALLEHARRRHPEQWMAWLNAIDPRIAGEGDARHETEQLAEKLWNRSVENPDEYTPSLVQEILPLLREVRGALKNWTPDSLREAVLSAISEAATDVSSAAEQDRRFGLAQLFAEADLLTSADIGGAVLEGLAATARVTPTPGNEPDISNHIEKWSTWGLSLGSSDARKNLVEAIEDSAWCASPTREIVLLSAAATRKRNAEDVASPYEAGELRELVDAHGDRFADGISDWVSAFQPTPADFWLAVAPLRSRLVNAGLRSAFEDYSHSLSSEDRLELTRFVIDDSFRRMPSTGFLDAIRFSETDEVKTARLLAGKYREATSNPERERVLSLWTALRPVGDSARRLLIQEVLLPLAQANKQGLDIATRHLNLAVPPPHGTKKQLVEILQREARDSEQKRRVERRLIDAGFLKRSRLLRRVSSTDE